VQHHIKITRRPPGKPASPLPVEAQPRTRIHRPPDAEFDLRTALTLAVHLWQALQGFSRCRPALCRWAVWNLKIRRQSHLAASAAGRAILKTRTAFHGRPSQVSHLSESFVRKFLSQNERRFCREEISDRNADQSPRLRLRRILLSPRTGFSKIMLARRRRR